MLFLYHDVKTNKNYLHPLEIYSFYFLIVSYFTTYGINIFDLYYILCYYNCVFKFLCYPTSGVWTIPPEHTRV